MYSVYLLRCADGSLYAGITTDLPRRLRQHNGQLAGGARYTSARRPVILAAVWTAEDRAAASRLEYRLKRLTHEEKERLCAGESVPAGAETEGFPAPTCLGRDQPV